MVIRILKFDDVLFQLLRNCLPSIAKSYRRVRCLHQLCVPIPLHLFVAKNFSTRYSCIYNFINDSRRPSCYETRHMYCHTGCFCTVDIDEESVA